MHRQTLEGLKKFLRVCNQRAQLGSDVFKHHALRGHFVSHFGACFGFAFGQALFFTSFEAFGFALLDALRFALFQTLRQALL